MQQSQNSVHHTSCNHTDVQRAAYRIESKQILLCCFCLHTSAASYRQNLSFVFSHRYFSPPARNTRTHWRSEAQLHHRLRPSPAPPDPTPPLAASWTPWPRGGRIVGQRRRRVEEPTPGPCSSPPNSASSCLRPPAPPHLPPQRRGRVWPSSSSLGTQRETALLGLKWRLSPTLPPASRSRRATEASALKRSDASQRAACWVLMLLFVWLLLGNWLYSWCWQSDSNMWSLNYLSCKWGSDIRYLTYSLLIFWGLTDNKGLKTVDTLFYRSHNLITISYKDSDI